MTIGDTRQPRCSARQNKQVRFQSNFLVLGSCTRILGMDMWLESLAPSAVTLSCFPMSKMLKQTHWYTDHSQILLHMIQWFRFEKIFMVILNVYHNTTAVLYIYISCKQNITPLFCKYLSVCSSVCLYVHIVPMLQSMTKVNVMSLTKASVTIMADFCPEFNPPFRWRCKHQPCISITWSLLSFQTGPIDVQGHSLAL